LRAADANPGGPFQNGRRHFYVDDVEVSEENFYRAVARKSFRQCLHFVTWVEVSAALDR
jgi:hypothetical protein